MLSISSGSLFPASGISAATSITLILLILHLNHGSCKQILLLDGFHDDGYDRAYQESSRPSLMQRLINTRIDPMLFVPL